MAREHHHDLELTQPKGKILRRIFSLARPYRWGLAGGVALGLGISGLRLLQPWLEGATIDQTLETFETGSMTWERMQPLLRIAGAIVLVSGLAIGLSYARSLLMAHVRMQILTDLRRRIYRKILRQSFSYFDRQDTGELINRTIGDVNMLRMFYTMVLVQGAEIVFAMVLYTFWMVLLDPWVALVAVPFVPINAVAMGVFAKRIHPMFHAMRHELDRSTQALSENVQGMQVVRAFGREPEEIHRYEGIIQAVLERALRVYRSFAVYRPVVFFLGGAGLVAMITMGAHRVLYGGLSAGAIYTVFRWSSMLMMHIHFISRMTATVQHSLVSAERVFEILDTRAAIRPPAEPTPLPEGRGRVVFENVTFGYDPDEPVLEDVTVDVPAGLNVALVGPTGSGKSTFIKLLPRFYEPQEGRILVDGVDLRGLDLESLRAEIGFVFQDTFLFSASLAENIAFGVPEAERRAIKEAARRARVDEFADGFDDGYETAVGERGISLSGGQRQRVAIARALLLDPRILILDDATASVDATTERAIQDGLAEVMQDRTTFIIAHRVSTVKQADLVLVIEGGRIVEQGTHDELMTNGGAYRRFVEMQWELGVEDGEGT